MPWQTWPKKWRIIFSDDFCTILIQSWYRNKNFGTISHKNIFCQIYLRINLVKKLVRNNFLDLFWTEVFFFYESSSNFGLRWYTDKSVKKMFFFKIFVPGPTLKIIWKKLSVFGPSRSCHFRTKLLPTLDQNSTKHFYMG